MWSRFRRSAPVGWRCCYTDNNMVLFSQDWSTGLLSRGSHIVTHAEDTESPATSQQISSCTSFWPSFVTDITKLSFTYLKKSVTVTRWEPKDSKGGFWETERRGEEHGNKQDCEGSKRAGWYGVGHRQTGGASSLTGLGMMKLPDT